MAFSVFTIWFCVIRTGYTDDPVNMIFCDVQYCLAVQCCAILLGYTDNAVNIFCGVQYCVAVWLQLRVLNILITLSIWLPVFSVMSLRFYLVCIQYTDFSVIITDTAIDIYNHPIYRLNSFIPHSLPGDCVYTARSLLLCVHMFVIYSVFTHVFYVPLYHNM